MMKVRVCEQNRGFPLRLIFQRAVSVPTDAVASRAVELLTALLAKAEKDLADLETKIAAEADSLGLQEMLPAELQK
jgi:hypothetical protein